MRNYNPGKDVFEDASVAIESVERHVDSRIWKTRNRIYECIVNENRNNQKNPFIENQNMFLSILMKFMFSWEFQTQKWTHLYNSWEFYEEGETEAVLFSDLDKEGNESYVMTVERTYQKWRSEWYTFYQIKDWLDYNARIIVPGIERDMRENGIPWGNIFYKKPLGKNPTRYSLPLLPAYSEE